MCMYIKHVDNKTVNNVYIICVRKNVYIYIYIYIYLFIYLIAPRIPPGLGSEAEANVKQSEESRTKQSTTLKRKRDY